MTIRARSESNGFAVAALTLALTACGGGGGGSGSVSPASGVSGDVSSLAGQSLMSYNFFGANASEEFTYGATTTSNGVLYRSAVSRVNSDVFSGVAVLDPVVCATWADMANSVAPGDTAVAAAFSGAYICSFFYSGGSESWYEIKIGSDNSISGNYEFITSDSDANGLTELDISPDASLSGSHYPSGRSGVKSALPESIDSATHEAFFSAIDTTPISRSANDSATKMAGSHEEKFMQSVESFIGSME